MRKIISLLLTGLLPILAAASDYNAYDIYDYDDEPGKGLFGMGAGLNTDGYELELSISYWPIKTLGFKLAIGCAGEIEEVEDWDWLNDDYGYYCDDDYTVRFKFMPSIELKSPSLLSRECDASLHLFGNPGLCLSPGAAGSRDAQWFNWQLRGGLELNIDDFVLQLGYGYSNFYLYSGHPISHHGYSDIPNRNTHSVFLGFGIRF